MGKYVVHPRVHNELWEIWKFIAKNNVEAATHVVDAAHETFRLLSSNPGLGRPRSFRRKQYRNLRSRGVVGFDNYLILYREVTGGIEILHVCHGARNLDAILRRDL